MPLLNPPRTMETVRRWLGGHVEAAVVQAALELNLLARLAAGNWAPAALADAERLDVAGVAVVLEALAGSGVVERVDVGYRLAESTQPPEAALDRGAPAAEDRVGRRAGTASRWLVASDWPAFSAARAAWADSAPTTARLDEAERAVRQAAPEVAWLVELIWRHVWSAGIMALARHGVLAALQTGARDAANLAEACALKDSELAPLLRAGQHTDVLAVNRSEVRLTASARSAFGEGGVAGFGHWMDLRLQMEHACFWRPLAELSTSVRSGRPASQISAPGASGPFRASFTRVNLPLVAALLKVARRVARDLHAEQQAWRVLEVGASLGHWGVALAAHPASTVLTVDTPEVLLDTQRVVAAAGLSDRYAFQPMADLRCLADVVRGQFDAIVLHQICHTFGPEELRACLITAAARLAPGGLLLVDDMLLEPNRTAPLRHVLSAVKLLVTGGGRLLDTQGATRLLGERGFGTVHCYRLPTTDLLVATRRGALPRRS